MMGRMASEAVDNYFADPGKMVTTATVLQCRPVGRYENPGAQVVIQRTLKDKFLLLFLFKSGGGHCVLNGVLRGYFLGIKM